MPYLFILIFMAAIFGLCFVLDRLCRKLFPKDHRKVVTLPRKSVVFGILLTFLGVVSALFYWNQLQWYLRAGSIFVLLLGVFLLVQYCTFSIRYDAEGFTFRSLGKKPIHANYADILGQNALLTRSGVNSTLYLKNGEVPIFSALVGVQDFLKTAFSAWCTAKNIDPDTVEKNPEYLVYFPKV